MGEDLAPAALELLGQIYYRLERFDEARKVYQRLLKETADDLEALRTANLMACEVRLHSLNERSKEEVQVFQVQLCEAGSEDVKRTAVGGDGSYEQLYNAACGEIAASQPDKAVKLLAAAETACRQSLADDEDFGEEEVTSLSSLPLGRLLR